MSNSFLCCAHEKEKEKEKIIKGGGEKMYGTLCRLHLCSFCSNMCICGQYTKVFISQYGGLKTPISVV